MKTDFSQLQSKPIRMGGRSFFMELLFRYAGIWILLLSCTAVAGLALGVAVDLRWFVAGLMVVFLVIPMVMAFLYYYYGLRKECFINAVPHMIAVDEEGMTVTILSPVPEGSEEAVNPSESPAAPCESAPAPYAVARKEIFPFSSMRPVRIGHDCAIIPFAPPAKGFVWIPSDAFESPETLADILEFIDTRIKQCVS